MTTVRELKHALKNLDDDVEILTWQADDETIHGTYGMTVETDMRTGKVVFVVCGNEGSAGELRDYETHPAFETTVNAWAL